MEEIKTSYARTKKIRLKTAVEAFFAIAFLIAASMVASVYFLKPSEEGFFGMMSGAISYPVVSIEGTNYIFTSDVRESLKVLKKYYEGKDFAMAGSRVDFSTEDGQKRLKIKEKEILNREINNKAIEILAKRKNIKLAADEIDNYYSWKVTAEGFLGKDPNDFVATYGWSKDKIVEKIIVPLLYAKKLNSMMSEEFKNLDKSKETAELAKKELQEGKEFSEVAKKYSQGASGKNGGNIGWISKNDMVMEVAEHVFSKQTTDNDLPEIIESQIGYHIIRVEETKKENDNDMAKISQIFVRKMNFEYWLEEELKKMEVDVYSNQYYWDKERSVIEFKDESMVDFENAIQEGDQGDISVSQKAKF